MSFAEHIGNIVLRKMLAGDVARIVKIAGNSQLGFWAADDYKLEIERSDSIALVASDGVQVVGFLVARLIESSREAEIYNIAVDEEFRRRGIGKILIDELLKKCARAGMTNVLLEVRSKNDAARLFYQTLGFRQIGSRKNFYTAPSDDARLLKLDLAARLSAE